MIAIRLPGSLPKITGELRIIESIGTLGFKFSSVIEEGRWRGGQLYYIHPDTVSVSFEVVGRPNSIISQKTQSLLADTKNFGKNSKKSQKKSKKTA